MASSKQAKAPAIPTPEEVAEVADRLADDAEAAAVGAPSSPNDFDPGFVDRLKAQHMPTGEGALKGGGDLVPRRMITFELDGVECEPGVFVNAAGDYVTFKITIRSLSSAQEVSALRGARDAAMAPMLLAAASLYKINDRVLSENERTFFWECLGSPGRQICMVAFQQMGAASTGALGKFLTSRSES